MTSQDPIDSAVAPEHPQNPTRLRADGLHESKPDAAETGEDASLKLPLSEHLDSETKESLEGEHGSRSSLWDFAKRNHVPTLLALGGIAWLLAALVRRSTERW
jgi:hypothetical protein